MKYLKLLLLLTLSNVLSAQQVVLSVQDSANSSIPVSQAVPANCLTDLLHQQQAQSMPYYEQRMQQMNERIRLFDHSLQRSIMVIPVVVHIIHQNGPENISDAQVLAGIAHLNYAFSNTSAYTNQDGVDVGIQFCLAKQDPNGNYTSGINRVVSPLTNVTAETQDLDLKELIRWDPTKYLNIWLVKEIVSLSMGSSMAGYAYYPNMHGTPIDGIVNEAALFGSSADNSKVHVHEAGHYLGLYHTFEGGCGNANCQTDGDMVCDTPPDNSNAAVNCYSSANTCTSDEDDQSANNPFRPIALGGLGDQNDMIENYMDYGYQICQKYFTAGQSDRMNAALINERASLLVSLGCSNPCPTTINTAFAASDTTLYPNTGVTFTINNPSTATYTWAINGNAVGTGNSINYGGFPQTGLYDVKVVGTNGDPACQNTSSLTVSVICEAQAEFSLTSSSPYSPGATIATNNTSQSATTYSWYLDGIFQHNNADFSQQFTNPGGHNLFLVAGNGNCLDTSATIFFSIGDCNISGMNNNWVFNNLSLNFSGGAPTVGSSPINNGSQESTTTISDPDGNLLFFSDGTKVWDKNQNLMPNGDSLLGHWSSTQSCLATPFPGNPDLYYLFTTDAIENNLENGFRYSIIDMSLNNGLGDVLPTHKNVLVRNDVGEMLSGTFHSNGHDIWITVAKRASSMVFSYLLTSQGLSTTPIASQMGTKKFSGLGPMKFSATGTKLACTALGDWPWNIVMADFNKQTGEVMNAANYELSTVQNYQPHSFEFSPDGSKFYVQYWQAGEIWQYDLAAGNYNDIINSKTSISPYTPPVIYGQLCRANDGRIYVASSLGAKLDYIAQPNQPGMACSYTTGQIPIYINNYLSLSMPNMIQGLGQAYIPSINGKSKVCIGNTETYNIPYLTSDQSVIWNHTGSGTLTSNGNQASLSNLSGTATISVTITGNCGIYYDTMQVNPVQPVQPSLGNDTTLCGDMYLAPSPQNQFSAYLWNTGSIATSIMGTSPNLYWVETTDLNGCKAKDSIVISPAAIPLVHLGADTSICGENTIVLDAGSGYDSYVWQNGSQLPTYTVTQPGTYWVSVSQACGSTSDTIRIATGTAAINLTHNGSSVLCHTELPFTLSAPAGFDSYSWQNGSTNSSIYISTPGTYYVTVTDANGCEGSDTLKVLDCLSIDEHTLPSPTLYPNPANHMFTVQANSNALSQLYVYDATGKMLYSTRFSGNHTVFTSSYAAGVYTVEIRTTEKTWRQKLILVH